MHWKQNQNSLKDNTCTGNKTTSTVYYNNYCNDYNDCNILKHVLPDLFIPGKLAIFISVTNFAP